MGHAVRTHALHHRFAVVHVLRLEKALTAAAANYWLRHVVGRGLPSHHRSAKEKTARSHLRRGGWQGELTFTANDLQERYDELAPKGQVDLVVIGCPQASLEELRITASAVGSHMEMGRKNRPSLVGLHQR